MKTLLATTILSGMLAFPAFAQMSSDDMSCADFTAMDSSGQMEAMNAMESGMASESMEAMESEGSMESDDAMASEESMSEESMSEESMSEESMSEESMSEESMGSDEMASGEMEVTAESVAEACADHPDMMVQEAVEQAKMGH